LIVGIVIDQFRYDYLERFGDLFGAGGFRRLMEEGAVFTDAQYLHSQTVTSVGHTTFMTGSIPAYTGIIANEWYERAEGKIVRSVADDAVKTVGSTTGRPSSPRRLIGSTLGDELKISNAGGSHVIGISIKDAPAILTTGHHPDGAYWFDPMSGGFITSTYYRKELPAWVEQFNAEHMAANFLGTQWKKLRPDPDYARSGIDDSPYEHPLGGHRVFPHTVDNYDQFMESPFSNDVLEAFAKAAIDGENLGKHNDSDLLIISFSSNDEIGHEYGPYSHEVEDVTLRTDIVLAELFRFLDEKIGRDKYVVALTGDHGVAPSPEQAQALSLGGGRFTDAGVMDSISTALIKRFGTQQWVLSYIDGNLYLDSKLASRQHIAFTDLMRAAADAALALPQFAAAYTADDFTSGHLALDAISQRVARNFFAGRSGDVVLIPKPYWVVSDKTTGHGTPYSFDTNVPVIFWGTWFAPGRYAREASPADIAPTLASLLRITRPSGAVGRVLVEALR
jgi:predicted AlkP superfamily pyrophosphatase or phosphodiesterase